jgi:hypothetical protein
MAWLAGVRVSIQRKFSRLSMPTVMPTYTSTHHHKSIRHRVLHQEKERPVSVCVHDIYIHIYIYTYIYLRVLCQFAVGPSGVLHLERQARRSQTTPQHQEAHVSTRQTCTRSSIAAGVPADQAALSPRPVVGWGYLMPWIMSTWISTSRALALSTGVGGTVMIPYTQTQTHTHKQAGRRKTRVGEYTGLLQSLLPLSYGMSCLWTHDQHHPCHLMTQPRKLDV